MFWRTFLSFKGHMITYQEIYKHAKLHWFILSDLMINRREMHNVDRQINWYTAKNIIHISFLDGNKHIMTSPLNLHRSKNNNNNGLFIVWICVCLFLLLHLPVKTKNIILHRDLWPSGLGRVSMPLHHGFKPQCWLLGYAWSKLLEKLLKKVIVSSNNI